ncbi:hypothetical protein chiPu_0025871, partial [Chiloscyllium punctatum]|nr:hypothetical protein [Chiloscyllium punctatum]
MWSLTPGAGQGPGQGPGGAAAAAGWEAGVWAAIPPGSDVSFRILQTPAPGP